MGYRWHHQTVGMVERGKRDVQAVELFGLALALDTDIPSLLDTQIALGDGDRVEAVDLGLPSPVRHVVVRRLLRTEQEWKAPTDLQLLRWQDGQPTMEEKTVTYIRSGDPVPLEKRVEDLMSVVADLVRVNKGPRGEQEGKE